MSVNVQPENDLSKRELIDTLKAPVIQMGKDHGFEVIENDDLGAGPVHVVWNFKPRAEAVPDLRLGFMCLNVDRLGAAFTRTYEEVRRRHFPEGEKFDSATGEVSKG